MKLKVTASLGQHDDAVDFVKLNVINVSKFPVALDSTELALNDSGQRRVAQHFIVNRGIIPEMELEL